MKIYNLPITKEEKDKLWDLLDCQEAYCHIEDFVDDWNVRHRWEYQAYFNGRSSGYLVFCEGCIENEQVYARTGVGIDMNEDFSEWNMSELRERVRLIQEFDKLADDIVAEAVYLAENYEVVDETWTLPQ
jgi:hypothetical protein